MEKIPSLFQRNYDGDRLVRDELVPGTEWVAAGEGRATRKFDGTCTMMRDGKLFRRYDLKAKKGRHTPPEGWEPAQPAPDPVSTSWPGWVAVGDGAEDQYFREAYESCPLLPDGTYELCGPKVQGNPEGFDSHVLVTHGSEELPDAPRDFEGLKEYLTTHKIEGIVWHHPGGKMAKIKAKDFGIKH